MTKVAATQTIIAMLTIRVTGLQLRCARVMLGLTQTEVAERARICAQSVKDWEHSSGSVPRAYAATLGRLVSVLENAGATFRSDGVYLQTPAARAAPSIPRSLAPAENERKRRPGIR